MAYLAFVGYSERRMFGYFYVANRWGNSVDGGMAFFAWTLQLLGSSQFLLGVALLMGIALLGVAVGHTASRQYPFICVYTSTAVLLSLSTSHYFGSRFRYLLPVFTLLLWPSERMATLTNFRVVTVLSCLAAASGILGAIWLYGSGPP